MASIVRITDAFFSSGSSLSVTLAAPSASGNQLVVWVAANGSRGQYVNGITDGTSNAWINPTWDDENTWCLESWAVQADHVVTTLVVTLGIATTAAIVRVFEVSGIDINYSTVLHRTLVQSNTNTPDTGLTTIGTGYNLFGAIGVQDSTAVVSGQTAGFTTQADITEGGGVLLDTGYLLGDTTGHLEYAAALNITALCSAIVVAFPNAVPFGADGYVVVSGSAKFKPTPALHEWHNTFASGTSFPVTVAPALYHTLVVLFSFHWTASTFELPTLTDDAGNTYTTTLLPTSIGGDSFSGEFVAAIAYCHVESIPTTVTATASSSTADGGVIRVLEFKDQLLPFDDMSFWISPSSGTAATTSAEGPVTSPCVVVGMIASYNPAGGATTVSGQSTDYLINTDLTGGKISLDDGYQNPSIPGNVIYSGTLSTSLAYIAAVAAFAFPPPSSADGNAVVSGTAVSTDTTFVKSNGKVVVSGTASIHQTPTKPSGVVASPLNGEAIVGWTNPLVDDPILSTTITPYIGGVAQTPTVLTGSPVPTFTTITGLTNGTAYTFTVFNTSVLGPGAVSSHSNSVTPFAPSSGDIEVGFEIESWDASTNIMIATLEGATEVSFQPQLNKPGSGSFQINKHDNKVKSISNLLQIGNLIRIKLNSQNVFAFFIEEPMNVEDSTSGPGDEIYTPQGRGAMSYLERAVVHPVGWVAGQAFSTTAALDHVYTNRPAAAIFLEQLQLAQARGALPALHFDFTETHDSAGNPWTDSQTLNVHIGNDLLTLLTKLQPFGVDFFMKYGPPLTLQAFIAPHQIDRTLQVVFRQGRHLGGQEKSTVSKHFSGSRTRFLVEGLNNTAVEWADHTREGIEDLGIREGFLSWGTSADIPTLSYIGDASVADSLLQSEPLHISVLHDQLPGGYEPFLDYGLGDLIKLDIPGVYDMQTWRIVAMTVSRPQASGSPLDYKLAVDLGSVTLDPMLRLLAKQSLGIPLVGPGPIPGGNVGGTGSPPPPSSSCCGGELLMAEATTQTTAPYYNSGVGDGPLVEMPFNVDTPNTRVKVVAHAWAIAPGLGSPVSTTGLFQVGILDDSNDVIVNRGAPGTLEDGRWTHSTVDAPAIVVLSEGSYTAYLHIQNTDGASWQVAYQVLIYLVTTG